MNPLRRPTQVWARVRRWSSTVAPRSPLFPEYSYAFFMVAFGVSLLLPNEAFTLSVNYAVLSKIMSEVYWGAWFVLFGLGWASAVATHNLTARRILGGFGALTLVWLAASVILSNPLSTIGLPFAVVACSSAYCAARLVIPWTQR